MKHLEMKQFRIIQIFVDGLKGSKDFTVEDSGTYTDPSTWEVFYATVKNNRTNNTYVIDCIYDGGYTVDGLSKNDKQHRRQIYCTDLNELFEAIDETHENYFD